MSATFDTTTKTAYDAATTATARATAIVASLSSGGSPQGSVVVKVYSGASPDVEMGSGTMSAPWATASGGTVVIGEVSSFSVGTTGTPDANWYIKFQTLDGTRWAKGSFGLSSSTQDFKWSLATFADGQTGSIGTATIVCTGNSAPVFTVAPTSSSLPATGGPIQFTAVDPDGGTILYSLTTTRSGITINSTTGLVTVTSAAAGTNGNIVVQASDGILTTPATCAVTVNAAAVTYRAYDNFTDATLNTTTWQESRAGTGGTITMDTTHAYSATRAFKSYMPTTAYRAEISNNYDSNAEGVYYNDEQWYGLSVYIPADWVSSSTAGTPGYGRDIIWQWHHKDWISGTKVSPQMSPATCLQIRGNGFQVVRRWCTEDINLVGLTAYNAAIQQEVFPSDSASYGTPPAGWAYTKGAWHHFVVQVKWHWTVAGLFRLWKNGTLLYERAAHPNCGLELETLPLYNKCGNYRVAQNTSGQAVLRELWLDNYRMMVDGGYYAAVDPEST
jgi:hypothetical protein